MIVASAEPVASGARRAPGRDGNASEATVAKRAHAARRSVDKGGSSDSEAEPSKPARNKQIRNRINRSPVEEFVWPGDSTAGSRERRQVRLQRLSLADH